MRCALTFDDGPSPEWTPQILNLLASYNARATFFMCGHAVIANPRIADWAHTDGHEIGNHTFTHPNLPMLRDHEIERELSDTQDAIAAATGTEPTLWRAPHFDHDERTDLIAHTLGLTHVGCTIDPCDWAEPITQAIPKRVIDNIHDGAIVDLHDGIPPDGGTGTATRLPTVGALRLILDALPDVEFVRVSDL